MVSDRLLFYEAGAQGLEPQPTEPESVVLPITPRPSFLLWQKLLNQAARIFI